MPESSAEGDRAAKLHAASIVIDACAPILRDHQYAGYWIDGGATCALATVALAEDSPLSTIETIGAFFRRARSYPGTRLALSADDIVRAKRDGVLAMVLMFQNSSPLSRLTEGMVGLGFSDDDVRKILGENFLRLFRTVWKPVTGSTG